MKLCRIVLVAMMILPGCAHNPKGIPAGTGILRGKVTDERGAPLQWANVTILGAQAGGQTNAQGAFTIIKVPVGVYTVRVSMVAFEAENRADVRVRERKTATVNFRLKPPAPIRSIDAPEPSRADRP